MFVNSIYKYNVKKYLVSPVLSDFFILPDSVFGLIEQDVKRTAYLNDYDRKQYNTQNSIKPTAIWHLSFSFA